ncbi:hypothetical protein D9M70_484330 [compost metagenome]
MVGVDAGVGGRVERILQRAEALAHVLHAQRAAGVHHVDAGGAIALHQLGLLGQALRGLHVAHHQEADGVHAQLAGVFDVLLGHVRLGAVGGHPDDARAGVVGGLEVVHRADAGQQQGGDLGMGQHVVDRLDPLQVGVRAEAVVERRALQAVAVGDFDGVDPGRIQRTGDGTHVVEAVLVADRMAAVAQGDVGDVELLAGIERHGRLLRRCSSPAPCARRWPAQRRS